MPDIIRNFFTNENPKTVLNTSGSYGIISASINPSDIVDGLTERGAGLVKLGSSMPSPMARLFLFSAALREVNAMEGENRGFGHVGVLNSETSNYEPTPYHDLVGEMLDMLEFIFKYGAAPDFHVVLWEPQIECTKLDQSVVSSHNELSSALRSAFDYGELKGERIYLFTWNDNVIGGSSPISLVYTSANLRTCLKSISTTFVGDAGNELFTDNPLPLHKRDKAFREYLYRLRLTDMVKWDSNHPIYQLYQYIQDSASNYDSIIDTQVRVAPNNYQGVGPLTTGGVPVVIKGVLLRASNNKLVIDPMTSDYILAPTVNIYQHGNSKLQTPMALTKTGDPRFKYAAGRKWINGKDTIPRILDPNINERRLPGFNDYYPYLTISDLLEDRIIEVSYDINKDKFFTGSVKPISFLLPLKPLFFEYFKLSDLFDKNGNFTDMFKMVHDEDRDKVTVDLTLPLVNGNSIKFHKVYNVADDSEEKMNCYDSDNTFDLSVFPFYRLQPDTSQNCYQVMVGSTVEELSLKFLEQDQNGLNEVVAESKMRSRKGVAGSLLSTIHVHVPNAFSLIQLTLGDTNALVLPIFTVVDSNPAQASQSFSFSIDFGTTNTHVAYAAVQHGGPIGKANVKPFEYDDSHDMQSVSLHSNAGVREFGAFVTALKREFVPFAIGTTSNVKFPMRTSTYQVIGNPPSLKMFFNSNIGFNYGEDISRSRDYKTNIKWDRFDALAGDRMKTYFSQILWMMKNKSVLNGGSNKFTLIVTYPISMRLSDQDSLRGAWDSAMRETQCDVTIIYRTESVAPYYSYLASLQYGTPYVNMDIGGGTTDFLYINPMSGEANVFSAFFAANDLWNDGLDRASRASKENGFLKFYYGIQADLLGDNKHTLDEVKENASSSEDIISYLFSNDDWTKLSETIKRSPVMKQLLAIHFSALSFYLAYALYVAEAEPPKQLSFTGMGSKYIKLISSSEQGLSDLLNSVFHYVGNLFEDTRLQSASIQVNFAPDPKEVTATGALISRNYPKPVTPNEDVYYGYDGEDPGTTFRYKNLNDVIEKKVIDLFNQFLDIFNTDEILDALNRLGCFVEPDVISKLRNYATPSYRQMKDSSSLGQQPINQLKEPMFFWPLKNSLYVIGKEIATHAVDELKHPTD